MRRRIPRTAVTRARELRARPTDAEGLLWWKLRTLNRRGYHFRRQIPFHGYTLDFAEHSADVVIELDGAHHGEAAQRAHDAARDKLLCDEGYLVLRVPNHEVFEDLERVVDLILRSVDNRRPPHPENRFAIFRPPLKGEVMSVAILRK